MVGGFLGCAVLLFAVNGLVVLSLRQVLDDKAGIIQKRYSFGIFPLLQVKLLAKAIDVPVQVPPCIRPASREQEF
jgi:hypothetical protein